MTSRASGGPGSPFEPVRINWEGSKSAAANAAEKLPELSRAFLAAGDTLWTSEPSFAALHRFRLLTKRFRYTLDLFRPFYGPGLSRRIEALRALQQLLGEINDCVTTREMLLGRSDVHAAERGRLVRRLERMATNRVRALRVHWREDFAPPRRESWWTGYLRRCVR